MEAELVSKVVPHLAPYFNIFFEEWSECRRYRIDAILIEKTTGEYFGIEFKDFRKKRGEEMGSHILQSIRYSLARFSINGEFKRVPILICPPLSYNNLIMVEESTIIDGKEYFKDRHPRDSEHHSVNGLLGSLNVGEVRTYKYSHGSKIKKYIRFCFSNKAVWDNRFRTNYETKEKKMIGIHKKKYGLLIEKINKFEL